jgi:hypothetical protein
MGTSSIRMSSGVARRRHAAAPASRDLRHFADRLGSAQLVAPPAVGWTVAFENRVTFGRDDGRRQVSELWVKTEQILGTDRSPTLSHARSSARLAVMSSFWAMARSRFSPSQNKAASQGGEPSYVLRQIGSRSVMKSGAKRLHRLPECGNIGQNPEHSSCAPDRRGARSSAVALHFDGRRATGLARSQPTTFRVGDQRRLVSFELSYCASKIDEASVARTCSLSVPVLRNPCDAPAGIRTDWFALTTELPSFTQISALPEITSSTSSTAWTCVGAPRPGSQNWSKIQSWRLPNRYDIRICVITPSRHRSRG